jgi:peptidylprolyl isomerase
MARFGSVLMLMALLVSSLFFSACSTGELTAKEGDTVRVLYTGTLDNGEVFDSSELHGGVTLNFTIGDGRLLAGFEQAVIGLSINESTTVHIPADEAYGPYDEELVVTLAWSQMGDYVPEVGEQITLYDASTGETVYATVLSVSEAGVTVDANHQLAGEDLTFEITLVEILTLTPTPTPTPTSTPTLTPTNTTTQTAEEGDTVRVLYTGTLDDGTVFDSSELQGGDPLEFTIGDGRLLASFEQAVIGLSISESTTVHIPADEAYGPREVVADIDEFPEAEPPEVGQQWQVPLENGRIIMAIVIEVTESSVTLENTHQLAGEDLNFEIQLVAIVS